MNKQTNWCKKTVGQWGQKVNQNRVRLYQSYSDKVKENASCFVQITGILIYPIFMFY